MSFKRFLASSLLSVAVLFSMGPTAEATTYTYAGNDFTSASAPYTLAMSIDISVTLSITLGANLSGFDALSSISSFTATDGVQVVTEATILSAQSFVVDTDAGGNIIGWDWVSTQPGSGSDLYTCTLGAGNLMCDFFGLDDEDRGATPGVLGGGLNTGSPGVWTTVVPEPSAALLLALGLAGLGWRGRVKQS